MAAIIRKLCFRQLQAYWGKRGMLPTSSGRATHSQNTTTFVALCETLNADVRTSAKGQTGKAKVSENGIGEVPLRLGPEVASVPMKASPRLHDPGDGLNGNGRRVLSYSDLRALYKGVDGRPPTREIILDLTGNMVRFIWGFDAYKFSQAEPIHLKLGERVRFVLIAS